MVEFLSSWAKSLGLAIVIVSILEMLLPNNKIKKYIRMIMGIYILFSIISPFVKNKEILDIGNIDLESYKTTETTAIDQTSMDKRIVQLYTDELEKDITSKIQEKGYEVTECKVEAKIGNEEEETQITKIKLNVKKEANSQDETNEQNNTIEDKIVVEVQKIKPINTEIENENDNETTNNNEKTIKSTEKKVTNADIQNIKKFLIEEYGVNEKCLEIN